MPRASQTRQGVEHLRAWRVYKGMSQAELAGLAKPAMSKATIVKLEAGKSTANFVTVAKLAEALGITREQLLHSDPQAG